MTGMAHDLAVDRAEPLAGPEPGPGGGSRPVLRIAGGAPRADLDAAQRAAADFLAALGIDVDQDGLRDTPGRMARAYAELFTAPPFELTTFPNEDGYDELVLARDIPFRTADALVTHLSPLGAGVVLEAEHSCMTLRGARAIGAKTVTSAMHGTLRDDPRARAEFYTMAGLPG
jgi:GTP cyclohydrolase IA